MKKLFLPVLLVLLFGCDKADPDPKPETYFELTVDRYHNPDVAEHWIILHNKNGDILDFREINTDDHLVFDTLGDIGDEIGITIFFATPTDNPVSFYGESYLGVKTNSSWTLSSDGDFADYGSEEGKANITIIEADVPTILNAQLSSRYAPLGYVQELSPSEIRFTDATVYSKANDFFLFVHDGSGNPRYLFVDDVTPGDHTIPFADFKTFDHVVEVNFQDARFIRADVRGYEPGQIPAPFHGYFTNFYLRITSPSSFKLGYLDRFDKYLTTINGQYADYEVRNTILGPRLTGNFELVKPDASIANKTLSGYAATGEFDHYESEWSFAGANFETVTNWRNIGRDTDFRLLQTIPAPIAQRYAKLNFEGMTHERSTLTKGLSFESRVATKFENAPAPEAYELRSVIIR